MTDEEIHDIAENSLCGLISYIKKGTNEILAIPDIDEFSDTYELWEEDLKKVEESRKDYIVVEKMSSHESFEMMERFAESVSDFEVKGRLFTALSKRKPFGHFKIAVDNSGPYRQQWFDFRQQETIKWVKSQLDIDDSLLNVV